MEATLKAMIRKESGKQHSRRLRAQRRLPAVLYGKENKKLSIDEREAQKLLNIMGTSHLIKLQVKKSNKVEEYPVLIKEAQTHPVKGNLLHLDLYEVSLDHKVSLRVPLSLTGEEERVNDGSILEQMLHEIEISCLPTQIPEKIELDVSGLLMNQVILAGDIKLPSGVELVTSPLEHVLLAAAPKVEVKPEAGEEEVEEGEEVPPVAEAEKE